MPVFEIGDTVVLLADIPGEDLRKGRLGTVVLRFDAPTLAYETEFADPQGRTVAQLALLPHQIGRHAADAPRPRGAHPSRKRERNSFQA